MKISKFKQDDIVYCLKDNHRIKKLIIRKVILDIPEPLYLVSEDLRYGGNKIIKLLQIEEYLKSANNPIFSEEEFQTGFQFGRLDNLIPESYLFSTEQEAKDMYLKLNPPKICSTIEACELKEDILNNGFQSIEKSKAMDIYKKLKSQLNEKKEDESFIIEEIRKFSHLLDELKELLYQTRGEINETKKEIDFYTEMIFEHDI